MLILLPPLTEDTILPETAAKGNRQSPGISLLWKVSSHQLVRSIFHRVPKRVVLPKGRVHDPRCAFTTSAKKEAAKSIEKVPGSVR